MKYDEVGRSWTSAWRSALALGAFALSAAACGPEKGGLLPPTSAGSGGAASGAGGASGASGGAGGASGSTMSASGGSSMGGTGGTAGAGSGGAGAIDAGSDTGAGDPPDDGGAMVACVFHTDPVIDGGAPLATVIADEGGADDAGSSVADADTSDAPRDAPSDAAPRSEGGSDSGRSEAGGDGGPAPSITVQTSAFVGPYLADSTGRTLYTYGGDLPGDCNYGPISQCERDCLVAWPLFEAGARTLAAGLDDRNFGTILRADGARQTTYFGWPLYYYKTDTAAGQVLGQAKAKTWHAATVIPVGIVILREATTAAKYLADGNGRTLYVFDQDTKGTATTDPVSVCTGTCLDEHPVFRRNRISVVSSLELTDFSIFVQGHARQQLAYKGAPLYYAAADLRSGDRKGATTPGWSVAAP